MAGVSPTALQKYLTCPRQYEASYITKEVKFQSNPNAEFGTAMHTVLEKYLLGRLKELPARMEVMRPTLDRMRPFVAGVELKLACDASGREVPYVWRGDKSEVKCIIDCVLQSADKKTVVCIDWKTGKKWDAQMQHDIIKRCAAAHFPEAEKIVTHFIYLFKGGNDIQEYTPGEPLMELAINLSELHKAIKDKNFPPKPNGLCGKWCDVLSCEHNGKRS